MEIQDSSQKTQINPKHVAYWRQRMANQAQDQQRATDKAWQEVKQMAQCLRQEFGAERIVVFGSLVKDRFNLDSDIDVAAEKIPPERYFEAVARVNDLSSRWVDLKPLEDLEPYFRERILTTGVEVDETN